MTWARDIEVSFELKDVVLRDVEFDLEANDLSKMMEFRGKMVVFYKEEYPKAQ